MSARGSFAQIGKYPVVRKLGEGATSEVYLCNDPFNLRDVAIKVAFPESLADPARGKMYRKLFLTEAKLAGKLQHPHICQVYDAVAEENLHYLVMEYVDGGTLEKYCSPESLLPVERTVEMIFKCTRALIASRGETTQVAGIGSPAYMSPEQVKDLPLDHRTDIYSIGVVMYHLLTGRLPFQATNNYSLIYQITHGEPEPLSSFRPGMPEAVDAIVRRAMAKDAAKRYANWGDFSADLAAAFRSEHFGARKSQEFADSDRFETLRRLPFFEHFSDAELWEVARIAADASIISVPTRRLALANLRLSGV